MRPSNWDDLLFAQTGQTFSGHCGTMCAMVAYKFLDANNRGPCTGAEWEPNRWVESDSVGMCRRGVHACRRSSLAHWLSASLWEVELDGVVESRDKVVARRGRLIRRIDSYSGAVRDLGVHAAWRSRDCAIDVLHAQGDERSAADGDSSSRRGSMIDRVLSAVTLQDLVALRDTVDDSTWAGRAVALAGDAAERTLDGSRPAGAPFVGAYAAGHLAAGVNGDQVEFDRGYAQERAVQSALLAHRLELDDVT